MSTTFLDAAMSPAPLLLIKVSLLLGAAGCVAALLRRRTSAATRHLIWSLALVGTLLLPMAAIALPGWTFTIGTAPQAADAAPVNDLGNESVANPSTPAPGTVDADAPPASAPRFNLSWPALIGALYRRRRGHPDRVARATLEHAPVRAPRQRRHGPGVEPPARRVRARHGRSKRGPLASKLRAVDADDVRHPAAVDLDPRDCRDVGRRSPARSHPARARAHRPPRLPDPDAGIRGLRPCTGSIQPCGGPRGGCGSNGSSRATTA